LIKLVSLLILFNKQSTITKANFSVVTKIGGVFDTFLQNWIADVGIDFVADIIINGVVLPRRIGDYT